MSSRAGRQKENLPVHTSTLTRGEKRKVSQTPHNESFKRTRTQSYLPTITATAKREKTPLQRSNGQRASMVHAKAIKPRVEPNVAKKVPPEKPEDGLKNKKSTIPSEEQEAQIRSQVQRWREARQQRLAARLCRNKQSSDTVLVSASILGIKKSSKNPHAIEIPSKGETKTSKQPEAVSLRRSIARISKVSPRLSSGPTRKSRKLMCKQTNTSKLRMKLNNPLLDLNKSEAEKLAKIQLNTTTTSVADQSSNQPPMLTTSIISPILHERQSKDSVRQLTPVNIADVSTYTTPRQERSNDELNITPVRSQSSVLPLRTPRLEACTPGYLPVIHEGEEELVEATRTPDQPSTSSYRTPVSKWKTPSKKSCTPAKRTSKSCSPVSSIKRKEIGAWLQQGNSAYRRRHVRCFGGDVHNFVPVPDATVHASGSNKLSTNALNTTYDKIEDTSDTQEASVQPQGFSRGRGSNETYICETDSTENKNQEIEREDNSDCGTNQQQGVSSGSNAVRNEEQEAGSSVNNIDVNKENNVMPDENQVIFIMDSAKDVLNEVHRLLAVNHPVEECERLLRKIKESVPDVEYCVGFWKCAAAVEESKKNFDEAIKNYLTAIIQGAEVSEVSKCLDNLFNKMKEDKYEEAAGVSQDRKVPKTPRESLDRTNIFKSSVIKFALQQKGVKEKNSEEDTPQVYVATPVRRSTRRSSSYLKKTPNMKCVASLKSLTPDIRNSLLVVGNPALATSTPK